jgi:hypothetical protein
MCGRGRGRVDVMMMSRCVKPRPSVAPERGHWPRLYMMRGTRSHGRSEHRGVSEKTPKGSGTVATSGGRCGDRNSWGGDVKSIAAPEGAEGTCSIRVRPASLRPFGAVNESERSSIHGLRCAPPVATSRCPYGAASHTDVVRFHRPAPTRLYSDNRDLATMYPRQYVSS